MSLLFSIVGDSNVRRNINKNSCRASPLVKSCQVLLCGAKEAFPKMLSDVRPDSNVCIVSCVSNFLADADGPSSIFQKIDPVLQVCVCSYFHLVRLFFCFAVWKSILRHFII